MTNRKIALLCVLVNIALVGCSISKVARAETPQVDDVAAHMFVKRFFEAFDARDYEGMQKTFAPDATIVHDNGVVTTIPEMMNIIRTTEEWSPRQRELTKFQTHWVGDIVIVGFRNNLTYEPRDRPPINSAYTETWVLRRTGSGFQALRVHYSLVTAEKHSEDV